MKVDHVFTDTDTLSPADNWHLVINVTIYRQYEQIFVSGHLVKASLITSEGNIWHSVQYPVTNLIWAAKGYKKTQKQKQNVDYNVAHSQVFLFNDFFFFLDTYQYPIRTVRRSLMSNVGCYVQQSNTLLYNQ